MTQTAQQQRRPDGKAAITGVILFIVGLVLLFNGVPPLLGSLGQLVTWSAVMGLERAVETVLPYLVLPGILTIVGLLMLRGGFGMLRRQGTKGAQWARSEWQERQPEVQQRVLSAREQLQSQGATVWEQTQQRAQRQSPAWAQQQQRQGSASQAQRPGWPGQAQQGQRPAWPGQQQGQQRAPQQQQRQPQAQQRRPQPPPPQPGQRQQPRGSATLERMQQRIADAATATDRARDAAMAKHEQQSAALQRRAERTAAHVAPSYADPGVSFGSPELVSGRRASSILASSSLRSTSLSRTSLSLDSLRLRR
ncbi:hypothetical protein GCM10009846_03120 [Agrococcus versicolor]|uniref:Uncharacterized protein n=1 Tax=Agrococcus versicolor TaxID=501482 RepID=A0ABP5MDS0_9MICO